MRAELAERRGWIAAAIASAVAVAAVVTALMTVLHLGKSAQTWSPTGFTDLG